METTLRQFGNKIPSPVYVLIIILPFLLFYWIAPFVSDLMMGNDFHWNTHQQMEILFSIKTGSFPLYHPAYALGQSSIVITWSQVFHPISHLSSIMPGYWNGKALQWYTFFKLLSLGLTQLVLFKFLLKLRINVLFSFLVSFITVYNLRMLDTFRFGASLEAYTAHLLLCTAIGWYFIRPNKWLGPLCIIIATYLLVVSGHPQHMYYGLVGAGLFLLVGPFFLSTIIDQHINLSDAIRFWVKCGLFMIAGILLASVYILPFVFDFYPTNTGRADAAYSWSVAHVGFFEMLGNFFMPFNADVHGAFGGSSLFLLPVLLPFLTCFKIKIPRAVWALWGILLFLILYSLGDITPVYKLAWKYLPFLSTFRHQGRATLIIPVFLMMLLIWIIKTEPYPFKLRGFSVRLIPNSILALIALVLTPLYFIFYFLSKPYIGEVLPGAINNIPLWTKSLMILTGGGSLIGLIFYSMTWRAPRIPGVFLLLMTIIQVCILLRFGTYTAQLEIQPTFKELKVQKKKQLDYWSQEAIAMHTSAAITQLNHSFIEPFLGKIYSQVIPVNSQDDAYDRMIQKRLPQQLFIEKYDLEKAETITEKANNVTEGDVKLVYSSFNRMQFQVNSQTPALFGFSYPYTGHWGAWVNGNKVHVYRANGAAHAVEIPKGRSLVDFRYWSKAFFWGMVISCTTFAAIGFFVCSSALNGIPKVTGAIIIFILSAGGFMLWYNSLYSGDNLETEYTWAYTPPSKTPNLAYGKKTSGYTPSYTKMHLHSSNAVDGDTQPGSGFTLKPLIDKALVIDLQQDHEIKTILLYGESKSKPLIFLSQDGEQWRELAFDFAQGSHLSPLRVILKKTIVARFLKIDAVDSELGIDELEVYGPETNIRNDTTKRKKI